MVSGRAIARGVATVTGARIVGLIVTLVQVKMTVTYLGPTAYGLLLTATLFVNSFGAWTDMGMGSVVVRRISGRKESMERTIGLAMSVSLLVMGPLVLATNVVGFVMYRDTPIVLLGVAVLSLGLLSSTWMTCYNPIAQVTGRFGHYAAADLVGRLLSISLVAVAIKTGAGLPLFFIAQLIVPVGQMLAMMRLGRLVGRFRPTWEWLQMRALLVETAPMTYIMAVGTLYYTIDGVMLSKLSTPEQVGAYGLAYKIAANFTIISASLGAVLSGRLAADAAGPPGSLARTISAVLRMMFVVALPLATLAWPLAPDIITFIGSEEMVPMASRPLTLVCIGVAIGMITAVLSTVLVSDYQQKTLTILNTVTLLLNIGLNAVFIPAYGASGAATALIISEAVGLVVCLVLILRRYGSCVPWMTLVRLTPVIAVSLLVESLLQGQHWGLRLAVVCLAYVAGILVFRVLTPTEIRRFLGREAAQVTPA